MNALDFVTHNNAEIDTGSSHLQGRIKATFRELCSVFGKPHDADGYKSDAEWDLRFGDGTVASIYNWKDGPNYCGEHGTPVERINEWHVGGHDSKAFEHVEITLQLHREMQSEPTDAIGQVAKAHADMLESIESKRGTKYADAVQYSYLVQRQMELFSIVLNGAMSGDKCPPQVASRLGDLMSNITAKIMAAYMELAGLANTREEARELVEWADRLSDSSKTGADAVLRELMGKKGGK